MEDCVFCQIIAGDSPVSSFYEDELVLGLMTTGLVIPKAHYTYFADMDEETGKHLFIISQRAAAAIRKSGVKCEGINLFLADGEAAFQEVFHFHMHVFPRFKGDPFKISADWDFTPPREDLDQTAKMIKDAYDELWSPA